MVRDLVHVQQQRDYDCAHACVSMVSGVPLEKLHELYPGPAGMSKELITWALRDFGVKFAVKRLNTLNWGTVFLVTVASLNVAGGMHSIVIDRRWDRQLVLDPQRDRPGKKWYSDLNDMRGWCGLIQVVPRRVTL